MERLFSIVEHWLLEAVAYVRLCGWGEKENVK